MKSSFAEDFAAHFFKFSEDLMCIINQSGNFKRVNPAWKTLLGYGEGQYLSKTLFDFVYPDDEAKTRKDISVFSKRKLTTNFQNRLIGEDGSVKYISWKAVRGKHDEIFCIGSDITEQYHAIEGVKSSNSIFTDIIEGSNNSIWAFDRDLNVLYINHLFQQQYENVLGVKIEKGTNLIDILPEVLRAIWLPRYKRVLKNEQFVVEDSVDTKQHGTIYTQVSFNPILEGDYVVGGSCMAIDLTKSKLAEKELIKIKNEIGATNANITAILEGSNNSIWAFDRDLRVLYINKLFQDEFFRSFGVKLEKGVSLLDSLPEAIKPIWLPRYERVLANEQFELEDEVPTNIGTLYIQVSFNPIVKNGKVIGGSCMGSNITERKLAEISLIKAKEQTDAANANITAILEGSNNSIWAFDKNFRILYINSVFQNEFYLSFGVKLEKGISLIDSLPEALQPIWLPRYQRVLANEQFVLEDEVTTDVGTLYIQVSFNPIVKNGKVIGGSCMGSNITERKQSEKLVMAEKLFSESLINSLPGVFYLISEDLKFLRWNNNFLVVAGRTAEEMSKISPIDLFEGEDQETIGSAIKRVFKYGQENEKARLLSKDGKKTPFQFSGKKIIVDGSPCLIGMGLDITQQEKADRELKASINRETELADIVRKAPTAIAYLYPDGRLEKCNATFSQLTGYSIDELQKISWKKALTPSKWRKFEEEKLKQLSPSNNNVQYEKEYIRKDGSIIPIELIVTAKYDSSNKIIHYIGFISNISERKKVEAELLKAKEKAEASDRLKSAFLANMSHEIRTPMNGILGFTSLLKGAELSGSEQQRFINIIERSGERMLTTINNIIDISKIESGQVDIKISEVNLNEQFDELFEFFMLETKKKNIKLSCSTGLPDKQAIFNADREKLASILTNLIKNAIKYTHQGGIDFGYSINEKNEGNEIVFYVKDTGIGIPEERLKAVFERFVQADIDDTQVYEGSGLGLAICKSYVKMMGGKIWVESTEGVGSQFYFSFPFVSNNLEPDDISQDNKDSRILLQKQHFSERALKILIVEDEEFSIVFLQAILKEFEKEILVARDGLKAVEICKKNPDLDLILMDIKIPNINGYEATRRIRNFNKDVVIIAQTAYAQAADRDDCIIAGCNDYITKPIDKDRLYEIISNLF